MISLEYGGEIIQLKPKDYENWLYSPNAPTETDAESGEIVDKWETEQGSTFNYFLLTWNENGVATQREVSKLYDFLKAKPTVANPMVLTFPMQNDDGSQYQGRFYVVFADTAGEQRCQFNQALRAPDGTAYYTGTVALIEIERNDDV